MSLIIISLFPKLEGIYTSQFLFGLSKLQNWKSTLANSTCRNLNGARLFGRSEFVGRKILLLFAIRHPEAGIADGKTAQAQPKLSELETQTTEGRTTEANSCTKRMAFTVQKTTTSMAAAAATTTTTTNTGEETEKIKQNKSCLLVIGAARENRNIISSKR